MASQRRRIKKNSRFSQKYWTCFWLFALLIVVILGLRFSLLTQLTQVTIRSNSTDDIKRLTSIVMQQENIPAMQISKEDMEISVKRNLQVKSVEFISNVFGRGTLIVEYREPVAMLESSPTFCVDASGVVFPFRGHRPNLLISTKIQQFSPILCLSDSSELRDLAQLAANLQVQIPKLAGNLDLDALGRLFFQVTGSARIVFGLGDRLEDKIAVLKKLIEQDPQILHVAKEINLVEPQEPAMTPNTNGTNK